MQHETSFSARLGFDEFDVSDSCCGCVVPTAQTWLTERARVDDSRPFVLTVGFVETHGPYPHDRYEPADPLSVEVPGYLPDTPNLCGDLADLYGAIEVADAAVGRLLDTLTEIGLDASTWVVFFTDHGPAFPRAKSTLYAAGTGIATIIRPPGRLAVAPRLYDELFSGVDLLPTLLDLLGVAVLGDVEGVSHASHLLSAPTGAAAPARDRVYTEKTYHDSFDPVRAIRTKGIQLFRELRTSAVAGHALGYQRKPFWEGGAAICPGTATCARALRSPRRHN